MAYRIKKNLNEELARINEIMVSNQPELLMEVKDPGQIRKVVGDVVMDMFTPKGLNDLFESLGFKSMDSQMTKFVDNFDGLRNLAKTEGAWNDMISNKETLESTSEIFEKLPDGTTKMLSPEETDALLKAEDGSLQTLLDGSKYFEDVRHYHLQQGKWVEVSVDTFEELKRLSGGYYDLPPFLRYSKAEIESALQTAKGGLKTVDDFLVSLQAFRRGTIKMTPDLRSALIVLMSETDGFALAIKNALIKDPKFYKYTKLYRSIGKLDELNKAVGDVLGLEKGAKLLDDMDTMLSNEGVLFGEWFDFVFKQWGPFRAINDLRFGLTTSRFRTLVSDQLLGGIFDYIMGAQILKSMYSGLVRMSKMPLLSVKTASIASSVILMYVFVGGYKTLRDWDINQGFNPKLMFQEFMDAFSQYCAGDNKVKDALTGALYANVIGEKSDAAGTRTSCGPVEFNTAFLKTYTASEDNLNWTLKTMQETAQTLYGALNIDSYDDHPLSIFRQPSLKIFGVPLQIPSITKIFREYTGSFTADGDIVKTILTKEGMDIIKMSQIADYYEKTFNGSLIADMQHLEYWKQFGSTIDFAGAQTLILKLPYLNPGQGDLNFDTWKEIQEENEKSFLTYPERITYEDEVDGEMMEIQIEIAKCGAACVDDEDGKCNCNVGGCNLGGVLVSQSMAIALEGAGYKNQDDFNSLCKKSSGFDILEGIYNETMNKSGVGCVLRRGR